MYDSIKEILESKSVEASAPCRIDMGGTLDISTFYYPLRHLHPCTFNIALGMRTSVRLLAFEKGRIRVTSRGFEPAEFQSDEAPFDHPLGLIFALAAYFHASGIQIEIESASPPRSALGGSSVAAVALMGAFSSLFDRIGVYRPLYRREIAMLAHAIEESVAGVPCGLQDQLAAAYGGVNLWQWYGRVKEGIFEKENVLKKNQYAELEKRLLLAYCGVPHVSANINQQWVKQFISGQNRSRWAEIISCTREFSDALAKQDWIGAAWAMNRETGIRREMTPDVLDDLGIKLSDAAVSNSCGARFCGAGGGGCIWALGEIGNIDTLREIWKKILSERQEACLLDVRIDADGLLLPMI